MIREYRDTDIEDLLDVWYRASTLAHPFLDAAFMEQEKTNIREIYIPNTKTWVFVVQDKLEGFISMIGNEVGAIFVNPEHHGAGIGTDLMDHVNKLHEELEVEVFKDNLIGRAFYENYGFEILEERMHDETQNLLLRMRYCKQRFA